MQKTRFWRWTNIKRDFRVLGHWQVRIENVKSPFWHKSRCLVYWEITFEHSNPSLHIFQLCRMNKSPWQSHNAFTLVFISTTIFYLCHFFLTALRMNKRNLRLTPMDKILNVSYAHIAAYVTNTLLRKQFLHEGT